MHTNPTSRRCDHEMAKQVQCGLSLLYLAGVAEACQYMTRVGISNQIIERVITAQHVRGARIPIHIVVEPRQALPPE